MRDKALPITQMPATEARLPLLTALSICARPAAAVVPDAAAQVPPEASETEEETDLRAHRRIHVFLPASIETDSGAVEVKLKNMSCGGALIETDKALAAGSPLLFRRGLLEMLSTVVWTSGNRAGLSFESDLDEGNLFVVTRRLPASASRPWIG